MTKVKGKIVDSITGEVVEFANIYIPKSAKILEPKTISGVGQVGAVSDENGNFEIDLPSGENLLAFSFVGYDEKVIDIRRMGDLNNVKVSMRSNNELQEVVITAKRIPEKKNNNTLYYILGGLVVLAILVYFLRKNNGGKPIVDLV